MNHIFNIVANILLAIALFALLGFFYWRLLGKIIDLKLSVGKLHKEINRISNTRLSSRVAQQEKYLNLLSAKMAAFEITGKIKHIGDKNEMQKKTS